MTEALEERFALWVSSRYAFAVSSGSSALQLACHALDLRPDDEVLMPALSFVAAANAVLHCGGVPVFVDVADRETPVVSVDTLDRAVTPKTRGICVMHYGGFPCAMDTIMDFARDHGLWVIEDAAHAPGARWQGIPCGSWGDVACFSFFGNKNMTCAEGGMIVTRRDDVAGRIRELRSHGMSSLSWDRYRGHAHSYDVTAAGFNFRMDDVRAAILQCQLNSIGDYNRARAERVDWYRAILGDDARWSIPFLSHPGESANHLFVVVFRSSGDREKVIRALKAEGIQSSIHYPPIHQFSFYRKLSLPVTDLKHTEALAERILTLPLFPGMSRNQVETVCDAVDRSLAVRAAP